MSEGHERKHAPVARGYPAAGYRHPPGRGEALSPTQPPAAEGAVYQRLEIEHGPFRRALDLGVEVDADAAAASCHDGILRVELPLLQPESRPRSVPIQRGDEDPGA